MAINSQSVPNYVQIQARQHARHWGCKYNFTIGTLMEGWLGEKSYV